MSRSKGSKQIFDWKDRNERRKRIKQFLWLFYRQNVILARRRNTTDKMTYCKKLSTLLCDSFALFPVSQIPLLFPSFFCHFISVLSLSFTFRAHLIGSAKMTSLRARARVCAIVTVTFNKRLFLIYFYFLPKNAAQNKKNKVKTNLCYFLLFVSGKSQVIHILFWK